MTRVDFVTVGWYWNPLSAHLVRNRLAENGLHAFIIDEFVPSMNWFYANAARGIKVQVPRSELEDAHKILGAGKSEVFACLDDRPRKGEEKIKCGQCKSRNVGRERYSLRAAFLSLLIFGFPLPIRSSARHCYDCDHREGTPSSFVLRYTIADILIFTFLVAIVLGFGQMWMEFAAVPYRHAMP